MSDIAIDDSKFCIERTWNSEGNVIRHRTSAGLNEYEQLTIRIRDEKIHYIPLKAYNELLTAVKEEKLISDRRIILI